MNTESQDKIERQILSKYPGTDLDIDIDWDLMEISFKAGQRDVVERIKPQFDQLLKIAFHGDYSNGNEAQGLDEGRVMAYTALKDIEEWWQAYLEKEGLDG